MLGRWAALLVVALLALDVVPIAASMKYRKGVSSRRQTAVCNPLTARLAHRSHLGCQRPHRATDATGQRDAAKADGLREDYLHWFA
jgi:hypothetical protein